MGGLSVSLSAGFDSDTTDMSDTVRSLHSTDKRCQRPGLKPRSTVCTGENPLLQIEDWAHFPALVR